MSREYDEYLKNHREGVLKAFNWIESNIPHVISEGLRYLYIFNANHDESKDWPEEYKPYDDYFYRDKSKAVVDAFDYAWLHHIHYNPHHWQYWVLINDDEKDGTKGLEIPEQYVIEMICDWWSFSFNTGNLYEIFNWYDAHKERMILHDRTRKKVEYILGEIKKKLDEMGEISEAEGVGDE